MIEKQKELSVKLMKVFEPWTDMPMDIRDQFFEDTRGVGNHCYVSICVEPEEFEELDDGSEIHKYDKVTLWLLEQGCALDETVIIKHSW